MIARRNLRISSSLFPENMGPHITSIQPEFEITMSNSKTFLHRMARMAIVALNVVRSRRTGKLDGKEVLLLRMFSKRLIKPELLDHAPPEEARLNLADLVRINSNFGGHATITRMMEQVAPERDAFTLLDIGAASGDVARVVQQLYPSAFITNLDYSPVNLETALDQKVIADAFALPFRPESF